MTFEDVLNVASSQSPSARDELARIALNPEVDRDVRLAAKLIVGRWHEAERTYFTPAPIPLQRDCLDAAQLSEVRAWVTQTTHLDFELTIDPVGSVRDIVVRRSSGNDQVDRIVTSELRQRRYLPAKPAATPQEGTIRLVCWIEVR